jgi:hypothetical protein
MDPGWPAAEAGIVRAFCGTAEAVPFPVVVEFVGRVAALAETALGLKAASLLGTLL